LTDEASELFRLVGQAGLAMFCGAPGLEVRLTHDSALMLSGEPVADLNMLLIGPDPDAERILEEGHALAAARDLPLLTLSTPGVGDRLTPRAGALGLAPGGEAPLMVLRQNTPIRLGGPCEVVRVREEATLALAAGLQAGGFGLPLASVERVLSAAAESTAAAEVFIATRQGRPISTVTVTHAGTTAGIWSMATPADRQGQGAGRALLTRVLEAQRRSGVERFFLFATAAGRPLYESLGFETVALCPAWVRGHSTHVAA
jgi:GNAT superfamily N-acetyltransferase